MSEDEAGTESVEVTNSDFRADKTGVTEVTDLDEGEEEESEELENEEEGEEAPKSIIAKIQKLFKKKKSGKKEAVAAKSGKKPLLSPKIAILLVVGFVLVLFGDELLNSGDSEKTAPSTEAPSSKEDELNKKIEAKKKKMAEAEAAKKNAPSEEVPVEAPTETTPVEVAPETPTETIPVETMPTETPPTEPVVQVGPPTEEPIPPVETAPIVPVPEDAANQDSINGENTSPDSDDMTDKILQDLETQVKESKPRAQVTTYVSPPDYEYKGRGLVYNCAGKHWACVDAPSYKSCEDNSSSTKYLKKTAECYPFNVYQSLSGCEKTQNRMVSSGAKTKFCQEN